MNKRTESLRLFAEAEKLKEQATALANEHIMETTEFQKGDRVTFKTWRGEKPKNGIVREVYYWESSEFPNGQAIWVEPRRKDWERHGSHGIQRVTDPMLIQKLTNEKK
jgi:hypothetical protein